MKLLFWRGHELTYSLFIARVETNNAEVNDLVCVSLQPHSHTMYYSKQKHLKPKPLGDNHLQPQPWIDSIPAQKLLLYELPLLLPSPLNEEEEFFGTKQQ